MRRLGPLLLVACSTKTPPSERVAADPAIEVPSRVLEEGEEPPLLMKFEANGSATTFTESQPFEIDVAGTKVKATVQIASYRVFHRPEIRFHYPRQFTFEADHTADLKLWTISGNDVKIMLQQPSGVPSGEQFASEVISSMIDQFGASKVRTTGARIQLGTRSVSGKRLDINVATHLIRTEVFALPTKSPMLLLLQDTPTESGENTVEAVKARELLSSTIVLD